MLEAATDYRVYGGPISLFTRKLESALRFYGALHSLVRKEVLNEEPQTIGDLLSFGHDSLDRSPVTMREVLAEMTDEELRQAVALSERQREIYDRLTADSTSAARPRWEVDSSA
jgi:hypothetical protein